MAWPLRPLQQLQQRLGALGSPKPTPEAHCRTALSNQPALEAAVADLAQQLQASGPGQAHPAQPAHLALVFCSTAYATDLQRLLPLLRQAIPSQHWIGCAGGGVVGTAADGQPHELEQQPGISVSLLWLPGAQLQLFQVEGDALPDLDGPSQAWTDWVGADPEGVHSMLLFIDPGCPAINDLISGLDYAYPDAAKVGGIAGQHNASHGSLLFNDQVVSGAVGCLIGGSWRIDPVVAWWAPAATANPTSWNSNRASASACCGYPVPSCNSSRCRGMTSPISMALARPGPIGWGATPRGCTRCCCSSIRAAPPSTT